MDRGMNIGIRMAEIRKAAAEDISSVARIESATSAVPWSEESLAHDIINNDNAYVAVVTVSDPDEFTNTDDVNNANADDACAVISCECRDSCVIGYADMWMIAGEAQLNNIAIEEEYRGNRYGSRLLSYMIDEAESQGCDIMTLEVRAGNAAAIAMYKNAGFTEDGIRRNYYQDNNEDALLLSRRLGPRINTCTA